MMKKQVVNTRNSQTNAQSQLFLHQSFVQVPTVRYLPYIPVAHLPVLYYMYYCRYTGCGILHTRASIVPICRAMSERVSETETERGRDLEMALVSRYRGVTIFSDYLPAIWWSLLSAYLPGIQLCVRYYILLVVYIIHVPRYLIVA